MSTTGIAAAPDAHQEDHFMSALQSISRPAPAMAVGHPGRPPHPRRLRQIAIHGECPGQSVLALLEEHAQHHPLNRALVMLDGAHTRAVSYVELAQRVKRLAALLSARFPGGGEAIAILAASGPAWGIVALATIASRNVLVPLDTSMEAQSLAATLGRVQPALLFCSTTRCQETRALAAGGVPTGEILPLDESHLEVPPPALTPAAVVPGRYRPAPGTALVAFTSGTTAAPKAVALSFDNLLFQVRALTASFALRPSDRLLSLLPMHHMLEFTAGFLCPLWAGAQVYYLHSLLPQDALDRMRALGITRVVTVPAWLALLKRSMERSAGHGDAARSSPVALRSRARRAFGADFEHFVCGGAPLADAIADFFAAVGAPVIQGYGLTETCPVVATNTLSGHRRGSVGRPLAGTETGFSASGEILVRGPHVARHYRLEGGTDERVADEDGWFHTGDLGHLDGDGFLYVTGRIKTTIVLASGKNVQPEEIERCLQACDGLVEACVVALGDGNAQGGEEVCLVAVPVADGDDAGNAAGDGDSLRDRIRTTLARLAPYKRPRRIILRAEPLPRTASGKLLRAELAEWARAQAESPA
jgi:long-chain acyl-CoA synthetase